MDWRIVTWSFGEPVCLWVSVFVSVSVDVCLCLESGGLGVESGVGKWLMVVVLGWEDCCWVLVVMS